MPQQLHGKSLNWKLNSETLFYRRNEQIKQTYNKVSNITLMNDGSLQLTNLQPQHNGTYNAEVHDPEGKLCCKITVVMCVIEKVSKPRLTYSCNETEVTFSCEAETSETSRMVLEWSRNGEKLKGEEENRLTVQGRPKLSDVYYALLTMKLEKRKVMIQQFYVAIRCSCI
ncbi:hypothetical protein AGOR_G00027410 [Albula goreensis]|uniref:Ig-like domain-containing protein n=1 Tax=Albula goreensis TaxID=1534307 RepID=A0A8T3E1U9_9TELE|nr:hypothetical protein AGOR_G00027410 [Albula goreensis]